MRFDELTVGQFSEHTNPQVRHVRCANEGDAFCEWEATWQP